ncbi:MAG: hypothetical protein A2284_07625 [Deltaproteobacteria bacterium RIFOXYA12_FULL_61_11]|nr:MAG: hypothetical protein A2284_07625 [Deltaproteobacteria bacterium RIFOXYA12_FULL_61_11]
MTKVKGGTKRGLAAGLLAALVGLGHCSRPNAENGLEDASRDGQERLLEEVLLSRVRVEGRVLAPGGKALAGAEVRLGSLIAVSGAEGEFLFPEVPPRNALLEVRAEGYYPELRPLGLARPPEEIALGVLVVRPAPREPEFSRLLFGGDVALGRRYLDVDGGTPPEVLPADNPAALLQVSDPLPGARAVFAQVRPYFQAVDFRAFNLESPVLDRPETPHPSKAFVFFTLPGALGAFSWLGVDYVSLGNNHLYDYLEAGLDQTLANLASAGLPSSGAGKDARQAFLPYRTTLAGRELSFLSMTSVSGSQYQPDLVASDTKGGAADLRDDQTVLEAVGKERNGGRLPVAMLHTGKEYSFSPSEYALDRFRLAVEAGASLVLAHHPHVAQGFELQGGVLVAHSLGNLALDQDRLETMLTVLLEVDVRGGAVVGARALPLYLEDYSPRPVTGELAEALLRRLGEVSKGVQVCIEDGKGQLVLSGSARRQRRSSTLEVQLGPEGSELLDLRSLRREGESLTRLGGFGERVVELGRDYLLHGDFEDWDLDDETFELSRWDLSRPSRFACREGARRGLLGLCSSRSAGNEGASHLRPLNTVRVAALTDTPVPSVTVLGYLRGNNAGASTVEVSFQALGGGDAIDEKNLDTHAGGTYTWRRFSGRVTFPEEHLDPADVPGTHGLGLRLTVTHEPPVTGAALLGLDDVAVVSWERKHQGPGTLLLPLPNQYDFLTLAGPPGTVLLELEWERCGEIGE